MMIHPCPMERPPLENDPLKDGVSERRPVMDPWEKHETQAPSRVHVKPYDKENSDD